MDIVGSWINNVAAVKRRSPNTVKAYQRNLLCFIRFMMDKHIIDAAEADEIKKIRNVDIDNYLGSLTNNGLSSNSIRQHIAAIRSFYGFLTKNKLISKDENIAEDIDSPKIEKHEKESLTEEEVCKLIDGLHGCNRLRNKAIYELFLCAGLRVSEVPPLTIDDMKTIRQGYIVIRGAKGNKDRIVCINKETIEAITTYVEKERKESSDDALFVGTMGKGIGIKEIQRMCKYDMKRIGEPSYHCHTLRRTFATMAIANGNPITAVQSMMGHSDISTTSEYVKVYSEQKRDIANSIKFNGVENNE